MAPLAPLAPLFPYRYFLSTSVAMNCDLSGAAGTDSLYLCM